MFFFVLNYERVLLLFLLIFFSDCFGNNQDKDEEESRVG